MGSFIIDFTNTSGVSGTLVPDVGFSYTDKLSRINEASFFHDTGKVYIVFADFVEA